MEFNSDTCIYEYIQKRQRIVFIKFGISVYGRIRYNQVHVYQSIMVLHIGLPFCIFKIYKHVLAERRSDKLSK